MRNINGDLAIPRIAETRSARYEAFDNLPPPIRRMLAEAPFDMSATEFDQQYRRLRRNGFTDQDILAVAGPSLNDVIKNSARLCYGPGHPQAA